jgi:SAM-dependent methyltransferase
MSFVSNKHGQFQYFDAQLGHPGWRGKTVLDFGGNRGNFLGGINGGIDHGQYWCIDVSRDAIAQGRAAYPRANWIFYDRYNFEFNPHGVKNLAVPDTGQRFDVILAYSVFTHTSKEEMLDLVGQLRGSLAEGGVLAFTFLDPLWHAFDGDPYPGSNLKWRLEKRREVNRGVRIDPLLEKGQDAKWLALVNDDELYVDDEREPERAADDRRAYITFCRPDYMKSIFTDAAILPPVRPERHHCCVIKNAALKGCATGHGGETHAGQPR